MFRIPAMKLFGTIILALGLVPGQAGAPEHKFQLTTGDRNAYGCVHDPELAWVVTVLHPDHQAVKNGVRKGDRLIKINEQSTDNMVLYSIYSALEERPIELTYRRGTRGTEPCTEDTMRSLYSHVSAEGGPLADLFMTLEDHKCDLNAKTDDESLPLMHKAAELGHPGMVRALRQYGAKVDEEIGGKTALHRAVEGGHVLAFTFLKQFGANPNRPDSDGWPGPHLAAIKCQHEVLKSLRIQGADATLFAAANGKTPEDLAKEHNCEDMPEMLQRWWKMKKQKEEDEWKEQQSQFASQLKAEL